MNTIRLYRAVLRMEGSTGPTPPLPCASVKVEERSGPVSEMPDSDVYAAKGQWLQHGEAFDVLKTWRQAIKPWNRRACSIMVGLESRRFGLMPVGGSDVVGSDVVVTDSPELDEAEVEIGR